MLSGLSLAVSREQDRVGRRWGNKGVVEWAWLDEGQKMATQGLNQHLLCLLHWHHLQEKGVGVGSIFS